MSDPLDQPEIRYKDSATYRRLGIGAVGLLAVGTVVYHQLEGWSWVDSLYFSTVALTTVGFGDLTPTSDGAKLFTVAYLFVGVSILLAFLNARMVRRRPFHPRDGGATSSD
ncbi:potassium channel family protein [Demequina sp. SYSU T00192]|uniref:Potassium channel family protein n=1 Tax=Demequina litoralis TaxID=3051660 RepID=A0ABT8G5X5_9MICO|nr:potassium channel family protein [Demequina sp. SYSU T00192]MDN4474538.1 potassium channel family protein [Demequina sp. SYSU T00192]